jgi:aspartyl/asparaginyl-tRNA synthetase
MTDYDNSNSGVLFLNDKKSEKAPDYTGTYNHEGEDIKIAGWIRTSSKTGKQFISIKRDTYEPVTDAQSGYEKFKEKGQELKAKQVDEVAEVIEGEPINLDDIPF